MSLHDIASAIIVSALAVGGVIKRYALTPIDNQADAAMSTATDAAETAESAHERIDSLEQLLIGSDAESDRGELVRIKDAIEEVRDEQQRSNRIETEKTYNLQQIVKALDSVDAVEVEEREDGYEFRTRGDERADGGIRLHFEE